jgi:hypothetical protein
MIWHKQNIQINQLPDHMRAEIVGIYHEDGDQNTHHSSIELSITDNDTNTTINYIIYSHIAKTMTRQSPNPDEILDRYKGMIDKYTNLYSSIDYDLINFKKFKSYTQETPSV